MANGTKVIEKQSSTYWIKLGIVLFIQLFFRFLPNFGSVTDLGMSVTGIFVGTLVGWCICDPIWPSLSCLILLGLTDYSTMSALIPSMFGSPVVVLTILSFLFAGVVLDSGLSDWAGKWVMSRKILNGRPWLLVVFILLTMYVLGAFCGIALLILLWELIYSIADQVGMEKKNRWMSIMVFALFIQCGICIYYSWNPGLQALLGIATAVDSTLVLNAWPYLAYGVIISLLIIGISTLVLFLIFKPDISALKNVKIEEVPTMTKKIKITLLLIGFLIAIMILPSLLPASWALTVWLGKFGNIGVLALVLCISFLLRIDNKPFTTIKAAADKGLVWGPIFICGTALIAAGALTSEATGVTATITQALTPIFAGMSPFLFAALIIVSAIILTNFLNNIVVGAIFIPIIYAMKDIVGIKPFPLVVTLLFACYVAFLLPSSNPMTALLYGVKDKIKSSEILTYASVTMAVAAVILVFIGYPFACWIYG